MIRRNINIMYRLGDKYTKKEAEDIYFATLRLTLLVDNQRDYHFLHKYFSAKLTTPLETILSKGDMLHTDIGKYNWYEDRVVFTYSDKTEVVKYYNWIERYCACIRFYIENDIIWLQQAFSIHNQFLSDENDMPFIFKNNYTSPSGWTFHWKKDCLEVSKDNIIKVYKYVP